jgi:hypothetical protein
MVLRKKCSVSVPMVLGFVLLASLVLFTFKEGFTEGVTAQAHEGKKTSKTAPKSSSDAKDEKGV